MCVSCDGQTRWQDVNRGISGCDFWLWIEWNEQRLIVINISPSWSDWGFSGRRIRFGSFSRTELMFQALMSRLQSASGLISGGFYLSHCSFKLIWKMHKAGFPRIMLNSFSCSYHVRHWEATQSLRPSEWRLENNTLQNVNRHRWTRPAICLFTHCKVRAYQAAQRRCRTQQQPTCWEEHWAPQSAQGSALITQQPEPPQRLVFPLAPKQEEEGGGGLCFITMGQITANPLFMCFSPL